MVIAANAARYSVAPEALQALIETTGIPVFTVEQARGLVSDDHPLSCFGYADGALNAAARRFREADVVLLLGKRFDHRYRYGHVFSPDARLVQVDPSAAEIGRNRGVSVGILGDIGAVVEQMSLRGGRGELARGQAGPLDRPAPADRRTGWMERLESFSTDETPLHPMRVFTELEGETDEDTILIFDGGDYAQWGAVLPEGQEARPLDAPGAPEPAWLRPALRHGRQAGQARRQGAPVHRRRGPSASTPWSTTRRCGSTWTSRR